MRPRRIRFVAAIEDDVVLGFEAREPLGGLFCRGYVEHCRA
ncbi:MAG: hypothetical protein WDM89_19725 [Rhizomicrobium sp.]